ncbi:hypothetical protein MTR67_023615 [Solanum verrucosum]|uniref:Uncharacterized protein n=1 Tax=Solanum verrucosum TaxID=315347 RepID=A0AAF0QWU7_SOLVR|nr:hypothetical protein MTR67_023615 [Solanum verrucosum]
MYRDLREVYWWSSMKKDIAEFVAKCPNCQQVKVEHQRPSGMAHNIDLPEGKSEMINMDFITGLPRSRRQHGLIWVIADRITKSAHFLPRCTIYCGILEVNPERLGSKVNLSTAFHPQIDSQAEHSIHTLEDMLRACIIDFKGYSDDHLPLIEFPYNNSYHSRIQMAPYEALYGRRYRSPIGWFEVSPMKGVMIFGKNGKLSPQYIGPYRISKRIGNVAYRLELPQDLATVHPVFHISMLKKCIGDPSLIISTEDNGIKNNLSYEENPVKILDCQVHML